MTWTLYEGDCLEVLASIPDGSVDAVVTDPPYNIGLDYGDSVDDRRADYPQWCRQWFSECLRVCRGPVLLTCGIVNLDMWHRISHPSWVLCWWKPASTGRSPVGFNNWEPVLLYGKIPVRDYCDVLRTTEQASLPVRHSVEAIGHPCPKPVELMRKLVDMGVERGGRVLDPFMGSGTTGVACIREGRNFTGIEINPDYFDIAKRRIEEAEAHRNGTAGELFASQSATPLFDTKGTP